MFGNWGFSFVGLTLRTWALIALLTELGLIFLFLSPAYMKKIYILERESVARQLGEGVLTSVEDRSGDWFNRAIVDTGVLAGSYALCERQGKDRFDDRGLSKLFANRLDVFWVAVRQMFFRFAVVGLWLPCVLVFYSAVIADAVLQRQILKYRSGAASPLVYHWAGVWIALVITAIFLAPMVPFNMRVPLAIPVGLGLIAVAIWAGVVRSAKRL